MLARTGRRRFRRVRNAGQKHAQPLSHRWVSENGIAEPRVCKTGQHGRLHGGDDLSSAGAEHRKADDAIAVRIDDRFHETAWLPDASGTEDRAHWEACHSNGDPTTLGLRFSEPDPPQLGISEHAIRNEPIASRPWPSRQIV